MNTGMSITRINAFAYRAPIDTPVETSFGIMRDRPAVFVRLETEDGAFGWGEVFANWPSAGAEHRVNLLRDDIAPLIMGRRFEAPGDLFKFLDRATQIRALQCGEEGPFRQVIAGLDIAMWDLFSRRASLPVRELLNGNAPAAVPIYASGIHLHAAQEIIQNAASNGFSIFKVKVGFGPDETAAVKEILSELASDQTLAIDANQGWSIAEASAFLQSFSADELMWAEEPMPAYAPLSDLDRLADMIDVPLAGGENISGYRNFAHAITKSPMAVLQPDVIKWGGLSGCYRIGSATLAYGKRYCPHYLGGGIGLAASAELLASVGGDGILELDVNPNPLREEIVSTTHHVKDGKWKLQHSPGLGIDELPKSLLRYRTSSIELTKGG
ncbi:MULTISPECIES: mandelate racemase/muconate lactonizing enzyme family protein [Sulfitobacter]|uniref:mandelate racemase/muconate lactonizing enzyme family protein n=1 Tax=Sulfitobacter TaxID=60136 RepID=UPI0023074CBC|nr:MULTISPECIES: mandelate racemase/muconate lactonizing enzyme family protein [Sulfitobacter]WCE67684.1 mandelate racemase/muconate lactonizing enzyme family protein [Sulfitobacter faviae]